MGAAAALGLSGLYTVLTRIQLNVCNYVDESYNTRTSLNYEDMFFLVAQDCKGLCLDKLQIMLEKLQIKYTAILH